MNYNVSRWSIVIIDGACVLSHGLMRFHHPNPIYPRMIQSSIWTRYPPVILYLCFHVGIDLRTQGTKYCLFYLFFHDDDTIDICIFSSSVWCPIGGRCSQVRGLRSKLNDGCYRSNSRGDKDKSTRLNVLYKWWKYWNGSQLSSGWAEQDWVVGCYRECRLSVNVREQRPKEVQRQQEKIFRFSIPLGFRSIWRTCDCPQLSSSVTPSSVSNLTHTPENTCSNLLREVNGRGIESNHSIPYWFPSPQTCT